MKNFAKWCGIVAGIFLLLGILLCGIGVVIGGTAVWNVARTDGKFVVGIEKIANAIGIHPVFSRSFTIYSDEEDGEIVRSLVVNGEDLGTDNSTVFHDSFAADKIKNLKVELGAGSFYIERGDGQDIEINIEGIGKCTYAIEDEMLRVTGFEGLRTTENIGTRNKIYLYVPADYQFDEIDAQLGAGQLSVADQEAEKVSVQVGAGVCVMNGMTCKEISIEAGAGSVEVMGLRTEDMTASVAMGEFTVEGLITGDLEANCGLGSMRFDLEDREEDHNFEISCAAGHLNVGGYGFAALAAERYIDHETDSTFTLDCNMGNMEVYFADSSSADAGTDL